MAFLRVTSYCSGVSSLRHSASVLTTWFVMTVPFGSAGAVAPGAAVVCGSGLGLVSVPAPPEPQAVRRLKPNTAILIFMGCMVRCSIGTDSSTSLQECSPETLLSKGSAGRWPAVFGGSPNTLTLFPPHRSVSVIAVCQCRRRAGDDDTRAACAPQPFAQVRLPRSSCAPSRTQLFFHATPPPYCR